MSNENRATDRFIAQFFQLMDPRSLAIPPPDILKRPSVQNKIYNEMFDEDALSPIIPPASYRVRVLKSIVTKIEASEEWDPEEDVFTSLCRSKQNNIEVTDWLAG